MRCRCGEIDMCREDKRRLGMSRYKVMSIVNQNECIQGQLTILKDHSPKGYTTENIEDICDTIFHLNDDIGEAADDLLTEIKNKEEEVQEIMEELKKEDEAYHGAQGE